MTTVRGASIEGREQQSQVLAKADLVLADERFIAGAYRRQIRADYPRFVRELRGQLENGLATVENFIEPAFLAESQASIAPLAPRCYEGETRKPLNGDELAGTLFHEVAHAKFLRRLANDLLAGLKVYLEPQDIYPVLNILMGPKGQQQVHDWHFDATYLTIAMPVMVPTPGTPLDGKFRIWPNVRRFSQSLLLNRIYWSAARLAIVRRVVRSFAVNLIPGNLYFFYGFRCFHGVDALDPDQLRAVCLMNFGGPLFDREKGKRLKFPRRRETPQRPLVA
jgi:hypothetical protein